MAREIIVFRRVESASYDFEISGPYSKNIRYLSIECTYGCELRLPTLFGKWEYLEAT
jgi:hypothetical protein